MVESASDILRLVTLSQNDYYNERSIGKLERIGERMREREHLLKIIKTNFQLNFQSRIIAFQVFHFAARSTTTYYLARSMTS